MSHQHIDRRRFLRQGAALAAGATLGSSILAAQHQAPVQRPPAAGGHAGEPSLTAQEALARLLEGNERFARGRPRHEHTNRAWRESIAKGQHPFATIIGCADSRVPPEILFDQGLGDLFVIRVAGQAVDQNLLGSFQYAGLHLHTPLCVVLGHERCGAVQAALLSKLGKLDEPQQLEGLVRDIVPAFDGLSLDLPESQLLDFAVEQNVRHQLLRVMRASGTGVLGRMSEAMVGMLYDLDTGRVRLLA
ncbi:MAG TPA: carbonic anhydrase [Gemmatimonadales bacterium]|nr:carbonic anhydrase [Gemmatimonadales bacterium]